MAIPPSPNIFDYLPSTQLYRFREAIMKKKWRTSTEKSQTLAEQLNEAINNKAINSHPERELVHQHQKEKCKDCGNPVTIEQSHLIRTIAPIGEGTHSLQHFKVICNTCYTT